MSDSISKERAQMPSGASALLTTRSIGKSNNNLLQVLKSGYSVLDVGCGNGAITRGICEYVGEEGNVFGLDRSEDLIRQAREVFSGVKNLAFGCSDVLDFEPPILFDVVTTARTLQWVSNPHALVAHMKKLLKTGGVLCVLDYDHTAIQWEPSPPASMLLFYDSFLKWRSDAGMDNQIALHVGDIMKSLDLHLIFEKDQSECFQRSDSEFLQHLEIWATVAETRGKQMVTDSYITEEQRLQALKEYKDWCVSEAQKMKLVLNAVHGRNVC